MSAQEIREYTGRQITLILDNDEETHDAITALTINSIINDHGSGWALGQYAEMLAGRGASGYGRDDYARAAGSRISEYISEYVGTLADTMPGFDGSIAHLLLMDLLDLGDTDMWALVAETFLPERMEDIPCPECGDETGACVDRCQNEDDEDDEDDEDEDDNDEDDEDDEDEDTEDDNDEDDE